MKKWAVQSPPLFHFPSEGLAAGGCCLLSPSLGQSCAQRCLQEKLQGDLSKERERSGCEIWGWEGALAGGWEVPQQPRG